MTHPLSRLQPLRTAAKGYNHSTPHPPAQAGKWLAFATHASTQRTRCKPAPTWHISVWVCQLQVPDRSMAAPYTA